jgi:hypothetical protein
MLSEHAIDRHILDKLQLLVDVTHGKQIQHLIKVVRVLWHQLEQLEHLISVSGNHVIIKTGNASVELKADGTIEIRGKNIILEGSGNIVVKSSGTLALKGTKIEEN